MLRESDLVRFESYWLVECDGSGITKVYSESGPGGAPVKNGRGWFRREDEKNPLQFDLRYVFKSRASARSFVSEAIEAALDLL